MSNNITWKYSRAKTSALRNRNICVRNIHLRNGELSAALCAWNGQIPARSECNYIIWTRTSTSVVLEDFASIPRARCWICSHSRGLHCLHVCECHNDVSPVSALRSTRVLQRVSEPRHSKAITVMFYIRYCSQLHRHSARFRIVPPPPPCPPPPPRRRTCTLRKHIKDSREDLRQSEGAKTLEKSPPVIKK